MIMNSKSCEMLLLVNNSEKTSAILIGTNKIKYIKNCKDLIS